MSTQPRIQVEIPAVLRIGAERVPARVKVWPDYDTKTVVFVVDNEEWEFDAYLLDRIMKVAV